MSLLAAHRKCHEQRAVFFDRDGILNEMVYDETHGLLDSPRLPGQVRAKQGAGVLLRDVRKLGYLIVVVTNQPGIAKGTLTFDQLDAVNVRLANLLAREDRAWDALYYCPHHPKDGCQQPHNEYITECDCRKPKPGMLLRAANELNLSLKSSWMIGDGLSDIQAGIAAGCRTILHTRLKLEQIERWMILKAVPDFIVGELEEIPAIIAP